MGLTPLASTLGISAKVDAADKKNVAVSNAVSLKFIAGSPNFN
jgi:hypothetical protein